MLCLVSWFYSEPQVYLGVPTILGVLVARQHVFDHPAWCGAASTTLCGGRGDPHPSWRSSLVESGAKVTAVTLQVLVASQEESRKRFGGRETILLIKCFKNVE